LIGDTLGIGAITAARRWSRLVADGDAWLTAYPAGDLQARMTLAFVQIDCQPGRTAEVSDRIGLDQHVPTVDHVTGRSDLLIHLVTPSMRETADYITHRLARLPGIAATRTLVSPRLFAEGSRWQVRAISAEQRDTLAANPPRPGPARTFTSLDRDLLLALDEDGRASHSELAGRLAVSASTVRRHLDSLLAGGSVRLRCELARANSPAPVAVLLWLRVPPDGLETTARSIAILPEVRMCAALTGPANLLVIAWLAAESEVVRLEAGLIGKQPWLDVVDRSVVLRTTKLMGRLLDEDGRATGRVPLGYWHPVTRTVS
jgi:DNA-binding Lrp family transcriptional regulator